MAKRIIILVVLASFVAVDAHAQNRRYRRRGVILGGLAGAAIGAAIGDKGDNETAGALIGGTVGAIAGGTIGNQKDQRIEHHYRYHSAPRYYQTPHAHHGHRVPSYHEPYFVPQPPAQPTPVYPQSASTTASGRPIIHPVAPSDVVAMVQSGLSEPLIIQQIQINGALHPLTVSDVIQLHRAGVSEPIINALQAAASVTTEDPVLNPPTQPNPATPIQRATPSSRETLPLPPPPRN